MKHKSWLRFLLLPGLFWIPFSSEAVNLDYLLDQEKAYVNDRSSDREDILNDIYDQIIEDIRDPGKQQQTISSLLDYLSKKYDDHAEGEYFRVNKAKERITGKGGLEAFLQAATKNQPVDYAKCGPIHELTQSIIKEANPELGAILFHVGQEGNTENGFTGHIILAVKEGNSYTVYNYGEPYHLPATNIIQLQKMVAKYADNIGSAGVIQMYGAGEDGYREYALGDETVYGDLIDKNSRMLDTDFIEDIDAFNHFLAGDPDASADSGMDEDSDDGWRLQDATLQVDVALKNEQTNTHLTGRAKKISQDQQESFSVTANSVRNFSLDTGHIEPLNRGKASATYAKQDSDRLQRFHASAGLKRNAETDLFHGSSDVAGMLEYTFVDDNSHWKTQLLRSKVDGWSRTFSGEIRQTELYTTLLNTRYLRHQRVGAEKDWTVWYGGSLHAYLVSGNSASGNSVSRTINGDGRITAQLGGRKRWSFNDDKTSLTPVLNLALVSDFAQDNASEQRPNIDFGFQSNNALRFDHAFNSHLTASATAMAAVIYLPDIYVKNQRALTLSLNDKNIFGHDRDTSWMLDGEIYATMQKTSTTLLLDSLDERLAEELKKSIGAKLVYTSNGGWKWGMDIAYTLLDDRLDDARTYNPTVSLTVTKAF